MLNKRAFLTSLLLLAMCAVGCVRSVKVPVVLPVEGRLSLDALVARVNAQSHIEHVQATVSLQFRDLRDAGRGKNKEYPAADGILVLSRPELIRLRIKAPFVGKTVADMVSDGTRFRLALLYPESKRKFVIGSNAGKYRRVDDDMQTEDQTLQQAGALANIRPQHLTNAFLIQPVSLDTPNLIYFLDETQQVEHDTRPGAKKGAEVVRTFYVLTLLERIGDGPQARVTRRLWFDRSQPGTPLARQELYEDGALATSIRYSSYAAVEGGSLWPERVVIERTRDTYSVEVIFEPKALALNGEVPEQAFQLENTENLEEIDLDKRPDLIDPAAPAAR